MVLQVSPDVELATLRELPFTRPGFIDAANPLYQLEPPSDAELQVVTPLSRGLYCVDCLQVIPRIQRSQITLTKFLGSGAFGEVYEGEAGYPLALHAAVCRAGGGAEL